MKKIVLLFFLTHVFAIAGIGVYGNYDPISRTPVETVAIGEVVITPGPIRKYGNVGLGGFIYVDVLPIIDLEVALESVGTLYPATITITNPITNKPSLIKIFLVSAVVISPKAKDLTTKVNVCVPAIPA